MRRSWLALAALVLVSGLTTACGGGDDEDAEPRRRSSTTSTTSTTSTSTVETSTTTVVETTTSAPAPARARAPRAATPNPAPPLVGSGPNLDAVGIRLTEVARFDQPLALTARPGTGPLYVAEKGGRVRVLDGDPAPLLDISSVVSTGGEQGLLGLAFSPDGVFLYLSYTDTNGDTRVDEFVMGPGPRDIDFGSWRNVVSEGQPASNHNGGNILFGPDGLLWIGLGDGGGAGDPFRNAQNVNTILGDILRINPRPSGASPYSVPPDNPFANGGGRPEIAVIGVRNPWRFSFDRATGDLWIGDVGQNSIEEIDVLRAGQILGANLGWPYFEGARRYNNQSPPWGLVPPIFEYDHGQGQSVAGGYVYRGNANPAMGGVYVFADTYRGVLQLLALNPDGSVSHRDTGIAVPGALVASFGEDAAGELYVMSLAGGVYRLDPA